MTGSETSAARPAVPPVSVAALSDAGPRELNEDRSLAAVSGDDGAWVIAVADGLGGHARGDEAAQAAVRGLPRRISGSDAMAAAFAEADERVLALTGPAVWQRRLPLFMFPMSTLCVAAWTPESGLRIGWMGDTLPFLARVRPDGFGGACCGRPHRSRDGSIDICLGMPDAGRAHDAARSDAEIAEAPDAGSRPGAVILASDGAWEPFVHKHGMEWLWDDSAGGGIGSACGPGPAGADDLAGRVLDRARRLGLDDNATVAAAVWH